MYGIDEHNKMWNGVGMLSRVERVAKICLAHFPGFGAHRLRTIRDRSPSYARTWSMTRSELVHLSLPEATVDDFITWRASQNISAILSRLDSESIWTLLPEDDDFPVLLKNSSDPPEVLFVRGTLPKDIAIAVVGSRKVTSYGQQAVARLVTPLAEAGIVIVSGLALGIDGFVHRACLDADGTTVAFLATGVDAPSVYPREHARLAETIIEKGGCLISESPPGTQGFKHLFPLRNRLIASFALATVVVEATKESGSLITARLALEENREVLAVPGPITQAQSAGTNHLLKLGAKVCTDAEDILDALRLDRPDLVIKARSQLPSTPEDEAFLALLSQPCHVDTLAALAKSPVAHVSSQLSILELKGLAQHLGGQIWAKKAPI